MRIYENLARLTFTGWQAMQPGPFLWNQNHGYAVKMMIPSARITPETFMKSHLLLPALVLFVLILAACAPTAATPTAAPTNAGLANPASVFCTSHQGKLEIVTASDGSQSGMCTLPDGKLCEEWAYFRGECGGAPQAIQPAPSRSDPQAAEQAGKLAITQLAADLKVDPTGIQVTSLEMVTWPDACLGLATADEMCAAVETPGFRVVLSADGKSYTVRTDASGKTVRLEPAK
jgi:uncharacterized protein